MPNPLLRRPSPPDEATPDVIGEEPKPAPPGWTEGGAL